MSMVTTVEVTPEKLEVAFMKWYMDHQSGDIASHAVMLESGYSPREAVQIAATQVFSYLTEE